MLGHVDQHGHGADAVARRVEDRGGEGEAVDSRAVGPLDDDLDAANGPAIAKGSGGRALRMRQGLSRRSV